MKNLLIFFAALLLIGCDYTIPLVTKPNISIDKSLLGLWQTKGDDGKTLQLLVLPLDDKEYLVSYTIFCLILHYFEAAGKRESCRSDFI